VILGGIYAKSNKKEGKEERRKRRKRTREGREMKKRMGGSERVTCTHDIFRINRKLVIANILERNSRSDAQWGHY
jgi:hypothetical protein